MSVIYKVTNNINGKVYIGQTKDLATRKRNHKSDSYNFNSSGYDYAFHCAIRKYGWNNFVWEILEEIPETHPDYQNYLNEKEKYYIDFYNSYHKGYNETLGGEGNSREGKTFEECCKQSKIFHEKEIRDIQQMLLEGYQNNEILQKYQKLSSSLLNNINIGYNFKRPDLSYPLAPYHASFSKEEQKAIIKSLKDGNSYSSIAKEYNISIGLLSAINQGKRWKQKDEVYPLSYKPYADKNTGLHIQHDLIYSSLTKREIAKKYNLSFRAIQAINAGRNRKNLELFYPLRKNKELNQNNNHILSCIDYFRLDGK